MGRTAYSPLIQKILLSTVNEKVWNKMISICKTSDSEHARNSELNFTKIRERAILQINKDPNVIFVTSNDRNNYNAMERLKMENKEIIYVNDENAYVNANRQSSKTNNPLKTVKW